MRNFTEEEFKSGLVNLHIHSTYSDGKTEFKEILDLAKEKGYKYISITDHNTVEGHKKYKDEILIPGVEFDCWFKGVFIHLLAYDFDPESTFLEPFLAKNKAETEGDLIRLFSKRNVKELIEAIHLSGGVAVLAHPACYWALSLDRLVSDLMKIGLDGIEVFYPYPRFRSVVKFHSAKTVRKIAEKYPELIKTGGTDYHGGEK